MLLLALNSHRVKGKRPRRHPFPSRVSMGPAHHPSMLGLPGLSLGPGWRARTRRPSPVARQAHWLRLGRGLHPHAHLLVQGLRAQPGPERLGRGGESRSGWGRGGGAHMPWTVRVGAAGKPDPSCPIPTPQTSSHRPATQLSTLRPVPGQALEKERVGGAGGLGC